MVMVNGEIGKEERAKIRHAAANELLTFHELQMKNLLVRPHLQEPR